MKRVTNKVKLYTKLNLSIQSIKPIKIWRFELEIDKYNKVNTIIINCAAVLDFAMLLVIKDWLLFFNLILNKVTNTSRKIIKNRQDENSYSLESVEDIYSEILGIIQTNGIIKIDEDEMIIKILKHVLFT